MAASVKLSEEIVQELLKMAPAEEQVYGKYRVVFDGSGYTLFGLNEHEVADFISRH